MFKEMDVKYLFSPERFDWSQTGTSESSATSNNSFCKICFNKNSLFKINFTDSFLICTNKECSNSDSFRIESAYFNPVEVAYKYSDKINNLNTNELIALTEDEPLLNSIQCYTELNEVLNKRIPPILTTAPVSNEIKQIETKSHFDLLEQETLFTFPNEQFETLNPVYTYTSDNNNIISVPTSNNNTQFDENFFEDIGDLLQNDLLQDEITPSYAELSTVNQQELNTNLAANFLYSNDFLNTTNQQPQVEIPLEVKQEILVDVKTKSGSGIKITRLNKNNKTNFCLSPTSSLSQLMDTTENKIQLSPTSIENNFLTKTNTDKVKLINSSNKKSDNNLLPWEVSHKSSTRRNGFKAKSSDSNNEDNSIFNKNSVKPVSKILTKSDLSFKSINQKYDFGKEKGAMLKKALLEDSSFLSLTNNNNKTNNVSAKDLVLNVLKKRAAV